MRLSITQWIAGVDIKSKQLIRVASLQRGATRTK